MARIEYFVEIGMLGDDVLDTPEADEFLIWMKNVSDQDWVIVLNQHFFAQILEAELLFRGKWLCSKSKFVRH